MAKTPVIPVAVIGMACRLPGGINTPEELWQALLRGDDLVTEVPSDRWDGDEYYDPEPGVPGRSVSKWGSFIGMAAPLLFPISSTSADELRRTAGRLAAWVAEHADTVTPSDNVAEDYWQKPEETERTFGARIVGPSAGTPEGPWLRTGDLGAISDGELFIMGRIEDVLIVYGRNHYPDDIEATIQEITNGRVAAISIERDRTEQLVAIIEVDKPGGTDEDAAQHVDDVKRHVTSALSSSHGLSVADLVVVAPGSIPITRSGKVARSACVESYCGDKFVRLDA